MADTSGNDVAAAPGGSAHISRRAERIIGVVAWVVVPIVSVTLVAVAIWALL